MSLRAFHIAGKCQGRNDYAERFDRRPMRRHLGESDVLIETADVAELHQEQQQRGGVLKARHDRLRREFDQAAELDEAEQRFECPRQQHNRKHHGEHQRNAAGGDLRCAGMNEAVGQRAEKKRADDARRIDGRGRVAKHHTGDAEDQRRDQAGQRAGGKIAVAERREREHAVAHGERNCDSGRDQATGCFAADIQQLRQIVPPDRRRLPPKLGLCCD